MERYAFVVTLVLLIAACSKGYDGSGEVNVLCELRSGDQAIQVITYQTRSPRLAQK